MLEHGILNLIRSFLATLGHYHLPLHLRIYNLAPVPYQYNKHHVLHQT